MGRPRRSPLGGMAGPIHPMTAHEKECALAAIAARIERAHGKERKQLRQWYQEIIDAPNEEEQ